MIRTTQAGLVLSVLPMAAHGKAEDKDKQAPRNISPADDPVPRNELGGVYGQRESPPLPPTCPHHRPSLQQLLLRVFSEKVRNALRNCIYSITCVFVCVCVAWWLCLHMCPTTRDLVCGLSLRVPLTILMPGMCSGRGRAEGCIRILRYT